MVAGTALCADFEPQAAAKQRIKRFAFDGAHGIRKGRSRTGRKKHF
jgi:hypothetical protein